MITEEIIVNFFEGKCDARDAALVYAWLNENPAKLKEYIEVKEWEDFKPAGTLSPELSHKLWTNIPKEAASAKVRHLPFKWMAVAASVLLIIGLSWYFLLAAQKTGTGATPAAIAKNIFNNTSRKMSLALSDGSMVELLPNSRLSYRKDFNGVKREVVLNGEATFTIAKNATKPFYVSTNSVLVTVLGTRFTVNSDTSTSAAKIILHEGSVLINVPGDASQDNKKEYYLTPGDVFIYKKGSASSLSARVLHLEKDKEGCYVFDNYPLDVVFDQLQIIYNTKIIYSKPDLGNRSFIGKIDQKDSLFHILQSIALLNNFGLHKQGNSFGITK